MPWMYSRRVRQYRQAAHRAALESLEPRMLLAATLLDPLLQPKFVNPLPIPSVMQPATPGGTHYNVSISQFDQHLGLVNPLTGTPLLTTVWGYNGTYPGATFETQSNVPITVNFTNDLLDSNGTPLPHLLPVDTSVHWAHVPNYPDSGVPVVAHLHGGHTESASDGLPEAWFTPNFTYTGPDWVKATYTYDNSQEAATLWYHDHALGITRLNVYAGLAGFYLLRDPWEASLNLPSGPYEIPIAIQDRMFTSDGQLYFPADPEVPGAPDPSVLPEFFGDTILVNGSAWPVLEVEPRKYRFRLLNGSDSRVYDMHLSSGQQFFQIGTDNGLLNAPVALDRLVLAPGERADVVVDFSDPALAGSTIVVRNVAKTPYPKGATVDPRTTGQLMAFKVTKPLADGGDTSSLPGTLRPEPIAPLVQTGATRQLVLTEMEDHYGRLLPQLGTVADGSLMWDDPITENPQLGDVEVWEIYNTTMDTHPIHLHLVSFQILSRQKFTADQDPVTGALTNIRLLGQPTPPDANEAGWKDTVRMNPGEVTRIIARFDREGLYVWHCHILSHEDHEMMRPFYVGIMPPDGDMEMTATPAISGDAATSPLAPALNSSVVAPAPLLSRNQPDDAPATTAPLFDVPAHTRTGDQPRLKQQALADPLAAT